MTTAGWPRRRRSDRLPFDPHPMVPIRAAHARLAMALLAIAGSASAEAPADLILHGGRVHTMDRARPDATAVAVRGDRILKVGTDAEVLATRGAATKVV